MSKLTKKYFTNPVALIATMLSLAFVTAGCGQNTQETKSVSSKSKISGPAVEALALKLGKPGRTDTFEILVSGVEKATAWSKNPPAGYKYIIVKVQITNISKEEASIGAGDFGCVQDEKGNRASWENYTGIKTDPDTFGSTDIAPGHRFAGSLIFAIPNDMNQTELHYTVGYSLKPDLRFEIR